MEKSVGSGNPLLNTRIPREESHSRGAVVKSPGEELRKSQQIRYKVKIITREQKPKPNFPTWNTKAELDFTQSPRVKSKAP